MVGEACGSCGGGGVWLLWWWRSWAPVVEEELGSCGGGGVGLLLCRLLVKSPKETVTQSVVQW